jgi:hypothetical protein
MSNLHDLLSKLAAIEESAKKSDVPAVQRKAQGGDWKVTKKDLDAEEKEGKISHKDNLAKNSGRTDETVAEPVSDAAPENSEVQGGAGAADESIEECGGEGDVHLSMQDLIALVNHLQGKGAAVHGDEVPLMGDEERVGEEYGNSEEGDAGEFTMPVSAVTQTGNDMFSKGIEAPKVNGGGNPMREALAELYAQIKERPAVVVQEGSAHGYNVVKWYEKWGDQIKLTKWIKKEAGLPKDADVYFDDADLVYIDKTILPNALVNPKLKLVDLVNAVRQATGGQDMQYANNVYREHKMSLKEANQMARALRKST